MTSQSARLSSVPRGVVSKPRTRRATSLAGTDLVCSLGQYLPVLEYGSVFVDSPGRLDHWPSGFVLTRPNEGKSNGRILVDRGDLLLLMKSFAAAPIEMTVKGGYVTEIEGCLDAELLRDYMEAFDDSEGDAMSHIGWGLQDRARSPITSYFPLAQTPRSAAHAIRHAIPLRRCTVRLDGDAVVSDGLVTTGNSLQ